MIHAIAAIIWKDLRIEMRTKEALSASFVFCVLVLVIFNFTLELDANQAIRMGAAFLWIAFAFGGILALNRSFALEKEEGCSMGLMMSPSDPSAIFVGKLVANTLFMLATELMILPLFAMFYNVPVLPGLGLLLVVFTLGAIGFSAVGTLFSAVAFNTRMRELMLPILSLPVAIPLLIAAVETTAYALGGREEAAFWFKMLVVYDVVIVTSAFLLFEFVMEE